MNRKGARKCPGCGGRMIVYFSETGKREDVEYTRRNRECQNCTRRETFYEIEKEDFVELLRVRTMLRAMWERIETLPQYILNSTAKRDRAKIKEFIDEQ